ncbi:MAG: hypothetical protein KatS3mg011_2047 [Acidimicrobiia bacterium]|nr:MAG: hypothetical protein KatS3mg011_2047 [Acidimicrobiia bacterium]
MERGLVRVALCRSRLQADIARNALRSAGVEALIRHPSGPFGPFEVLVGETDAPYARELIGGLGGRRSALELLSPARLLVAVAVLVALVAGVVFLVRLAV